MGFYNLFWRSVAKTTHEKTKARAQAHDYCQRLIAEERLWDREPPDGTGGGLRVVSSGYRWNTVVLVQTAGRMPRNIIPFRKV
jgi:hypothetical protein